jgi:outer membrane protein TolC
MDSVASAILHELMPNLYASLGISGRAGGATPTSGAADVPYGDGWLPDVANWHAGLVLQWSIFDMTVLRRRSAAQARGDVARADLDVARTAVTLAAQRSFLALDASLRILPSLESAVAAARANQNQAEVRFQAGLGNTLEVADAEALLTQAELELAIGRFNAARARAALGRALGESQEKP